MKVTIPTCNYEGQSIKRYGEVTLRFRVPESHLPEAMKTVLAKEKDCVAAVFLEDEKKVIGTVEFGGLRIDRTGEAVVALDTTVDQIKLPIAQLREILEEDIRLVIAWKDD